MKISMIIPSMNRPQMFENAVRSFIETTRNYETEIISVIDCDLETLMVAGTLCDKISYSRTKRGALKAWNIGLSMSEIEDNDLIFPYGDDSLCHPGWLELAIESHRNKLGGYGVIGLNDGAYDGNLQLATTVIFDKKFCKEKLGGVITYPVYNYYCVDSEINARAKLHNAFYWESRAKVEHLHSAHGKRPVDDHDLHRMDNNFADLDNKLFEERKQQGFPNNFESVLK